MGDSGCHVYSSTGKKHHSIVSDLRSSAGYPNIHDLTEIGAHPYRLLVVFRGWINRHLQFGITKPGKPGEGAFFGRDFVVHWFDSHSGLQMNTSRYTGLNFVSPSGKTVFDEYKLLMEELSRFSQAIYCHSDCPERFGMDGLLEHEARVLAATARDYGLITYSMASHWDLIKPFCLGMESGSERVNLWHHADYQDQHFLGPAGQAAHVCRRCQQLRGVQWATLPT